MRLGVARERYKKLYGGFTHQVSCIVYCSVVYCGIEERKHARVHLKRSEFPSILKIA